MATKISMTAAVGFGALLLLAGSASGDEKQSGNVRLLRTPNNGIQPQVALDGKGTLHLIYFSGKDAAGDIFYVHSADGGDKFSRPLRVNNQPGSAIAVGNIRGAHLAIGKNGRVHVAWMGSDQAMPKAANNATPMLYTRLNDAGKEFEPERNLIQVAPGLDGGGSVAADTAGNVHVAWHAPEPGKRGENNRRVWVATSTDDGKTFASEKPSSKNDTGACGCCGMRAFADSRGDVYMLYRSAAQEVNRDTYLLSSKKTGDVFQSEDLHKWNVGSCPMSSFAFGEGPQGILAAWETDGQIYFTTIDTKSGKRSEISATPGSGKGRKHPAIAANSLGETILVWTEGMGWNRGGSLAWQVFDKDGRPSLEKGRANGVPKWSLVAVYARPNGGFTVVY